VEASAGLAAVLWVSFVPMLLIAPAYYYMNRADPGLRHDVLLGDRAMGPSRAGSAAGRSSWPTSIVMANLAQIAGLYSFLLFGWTAPRPRRRRSPSSASSGSRS
jgi:hypothetical protein